MKYVFDFLDRFPDTTTIIVNGGDPLMVKPEYYWKIIEYLDEHDMDTTLSFTTNLWAFFKKPTMWEVLFKEPRVGVGTSFNYGNTRRVTKKQVYTEEMFWKVSDMMLDRVGYRPDFISVITEENEDTAIDNVRLAKKMGVECKLNYAMASGEQCQPYRLSKIYKIYVEIYNAGLAEWEFNTKQMMTRLTNDGTMCPQTRVCDSNIRAFNPGGDYYSCGAFGDDQEYPINFYKEINQVEIEHPLSSHVELNSLKDECYSCRMFKICNGCFKTIKDLKQHNMVNEHCTEMKALMPEIISINENLLTQR